MEHLLDESMYQRCERDIWPLTWLGYEDHDQIQQYEIVPVEEYPRIRGWSRAQIDALQNPYALDENGLAMLQSMLFFGAWEFLSGKRLSTTDYIVETSRKQLLQTRSLRHLILLIWREIQKEAEEGNSTKHQERLERFIQAYTTVAGWFTRFTQETRHTGLVINEVKSLGRQARLTLEAMESIKLLLPPEYANSWVSESLGLQAWGLDLDAYRRQLKSNGWCPSFFNQLQYEGLSVVEFACLVNVRDDMPYWKHTDCNERECAASNVDTSAWTSNHRARNCVCDRIAVPLSAIRAVLESGTYFVLDGDLLLAGDPCGNAIVPIATGLSYVAFSHVWSHGLGGVAEDGLPRCQLEYLVQILQDEACEEIPNKLFWIDPMCIPQDEELRTTSIKFMDQIYSNASAVIALDSSLEMTSLHDLTVEEFALRVITSDWNRRLWNLQEALLSKTVLVKAKERCISIQQLHYLLCTGLPTTVATKFRRQLSIMTLGRSRRPTSILLLLRSRMASNRADEPLVIATLLGMDSGSLFSLNAEDRMYRMWEMWGERDGDDRNIPHAIPFSMLPKLSKPCYRWAPRTFMALEKFNITGYLTADATITKDGLRILCHILRFSNVQLKLRSGRCLTIGVSSMGLSQFHVFAHRDVTLDAIALEELPVDSNMRQDAYIDAMGLLSESANTSGSSRYEYQCHIDAQRTQGQHGCSKIQASITQEWILLA
ncbi:hypothetical protein BGZ57DRAFT_880361 [Hyaloscypha finlandica]|nr:hypothetical protein BGZ57DRAFT_880361 [Hyaloscypha finlandica]